MTLSPRARARDRRPTRLAFGLFCGLLGAAGHAAAQLPLRSALPWALLDPPARGRALLVDASLYDDSDSGWRARRLGATAAWSRGGPGCLFLRASWFALDSGDRPLTSRWPGLVVAGQEDWPGGSSAVGWGNPEIGWLSSLRIAGLGPCEFGLAAALPVGRDELYPFASTSLPVRAQLRRAWNLGAGCGLAVCGGAVVSFDSARDHLPPEAYPGGRSGSLEFVWRATPRHALVVGVAGEWGGGARAIQPMLAWQVPVGGQQEMTLTLRRDLAGSADRPFATEASIGWTLRPAPVLEPQVAK